MARGKKKEELTLEEKLEQALMPVEEQPYEVPENWCWTYLTHGFCECMDSFRKPINASERAKRVGKIPYYGATGQVGWIDDYLTDEQLVLVGEDGAPFFDTVKDKAYMINGKAWVNNHAHILMSYYGEVGNKYIMNYLNSFNYRGYVNGTTRLKLTQASMNNIPVPLPPLTEQQRIVDRVESLFAKLDEAKEKVQEVIDQYELKTTSILHKAFVGDLSLKWRTMHGTTKENWDVKRIKDVCKPRAGYAFNSKKFQNHGCQIIRMGNLYGGVLDLSRSPVFICEDELDEKIIDRAKIKNGDILITLTGTKYKRDYGYAVCIENPENLYVNQRILCLTPNANINRDYLLYYLRSNIFRDIFFSNETGGVNQGNVSSKFVENIEIQVPPIEEQIAIITVMNNILLEEERTKKFAECVLQRIDLMKKSILTKAFRGELGTNNPEEESAIKLLKKYL